MKQDKKYYFNWASGTGGDFLIGVLHLLYPFPHITNIKVNHLNQWSHTIDPVEEERLRPFAVEDQPTIQKYLEDTNPGELFQYHQHCEMPLKIPPNTKAINLTTGDIYVESFIAHLYNIKCREADSIKNISIMRQSSLIAGALNINYDTLFDHPSNGTIFEILNMFGRSDGFSPSIAPVLSAYHKANVELVNQPINSMHKSITTINTFNDLLAHFEIG